MLNFKTTIVILTLALSSFTAAEAKIKVVSSLTDPASIAEFIGGDLIDVESLARGDQDPHFVNPVPSMALTLQDADVLLDVGLELNGTWLPQLIDRARNRDIRFGANGFVDCSVYVEKLEVLGAAADRTMGDIHRQGNPHYNSDPISGIKMARAIAAGLARVDPSNADAYNAGYEKFQSEINNRLFGEDLVKLVGANRLVREMNAGTLETFLQREHEGATLASRLGGWAKTMLPYRGRKFVAYHKSWSYFVHRFGLDVHNYVEPQPGVQPSRRHLEGLIDSMKAEDIHLIVHAAFYESSAIELVANHTNAVVLPLPIYVGGVDEAGDYFEFIDHLVKSFSEGFEKIKN
ncbi:MAG: metal ABC transporter substrate-binding protein [Planctomycetes bacterium]|nr:metal ABC transporter substrate-binding protein [Planctomycetota bacterium]